jgi:sigma-B regulation protein RsbU (phosphoserine phosphatase)
MEAQSTLSSAVARKRILLADDQGTVLEALRLLLKQAGYEADAVTRPGEVLAALESKDYDLVLMDLNYTQDTTSGREGLDLLTRIRGLQKEVPLVVMTAWGNMELAIEAMRRGARDFIQKPWDNQQVLETLREQISDHARRLGRAKQWESEMAEAREVQQYFLQRAVPELQGYGICASSRPVRTLGGDFFDIAKESEDQAAMCIADVAGKGAGAALLLSSLQAVLRSIGSRSPAPVCAELNRVLCQIAPPGKFVSFFYCRLEPGRRLRYCNAGHNPPILVREQGAVQRLESNDAVLGYFHDWRYREGTVELRPGDRLIVFTDGMVEAFDDEGRDFGDEALVRLAAEQRGCSASRLHRLLSSAVLDHCGGQLQDDATLAVVAVE